MRITDSTIVITGASSGIGRATALRLAGEGANVVLAARREAALEDLSSQCIAAGAPEATVVVTDVTDREAVERLKETALEVNGKIDAWINNAGVYAVGKFEEIPPEAFDRVIETNVIGYANGARAVLPQFRKQKSGSLINVVSLNAHVPGAMVSPYTASKWALYGFTEALRQELRDVSEIHVGSVSPSAIDTPIWQHGANYSGRAVKALSPLLPPEDVADAIVQQLKKPRREIIVGTTGRILSFARKLAPAPIDRWMARQVEHSHFKEGSATNTAGNLFEPVSAGDTASGGWR